MRQQLTEIKEGELDFGYVRPPAVVASELSMLNVLRERPVVGLPEGHLLSARSSLDLADLPDFTFITPRQPPDVGFHANTIAACGDAGYHPKIAATGRDFTTIISMVAVGLGISLVPDSLQCMKMPGVRYIPVSNYMITSDLAIVYRKSETPSVVRAFIAHHKLLADSAY